MAVSTTKSFSGKIVRFPALFSSDGDMFVLCTDEGAVVLTLHCETSDTWGGVALRLEIIDPPAEDVAGLDLTGGADTTALFQRLQRKDDDGLFEVAFDPILWPTSEEDESKGSDPRKGYCAATVLPRPSTSNGFAVATLTLDHRLCLHTKSVTMDKWTEVVDVSEMWCAEMRERISDLIASRLRGRVKTGSDEQLARVVLTTQLLTSTALCVSHLLDCPGPEQPEGDAARSDTDMRNEFCLLASAQKSGHIAFWRVTLPLIDSDCISLMTIIEASTEGGITALHWCHINSLTGLLVIGLQTGEVTSLLVEWNSASAQPQASAHTLWTDADRLRPRVFTWLHEERVLLVGKGPYVVALRLRVDVEEKEKAADVGVAASSIMLVGSSLPVTDLSNRCGTVVGCTDDGKTFTIEVDSRNEAIKLSTTPVEVALPGPMLWRCHGVGLSRNAVFLASLHSPKEVFCHLSTRLPVKVGYTSLKNLDEVVDMLLSQEDLRGMRDALAFVQRNVDTGSFPDKLETLLDPTRLTTLSTVHQKLCRLLLLQLKAVKKTKEDTDANIETVEVLIMQKHLQRSLQSASEHQLTQTDRTSVKLMCDWLETNGSCDLTELASRIKVELDLSEEEKPTCAVCGQSYADLQGLFLAGCPNGHRFGRCCQTLLVCAEPGHRTCAHCGVLALNSRTTKGSSDWLRTVLGNYCTMCDGELT